MTQVTASNTDFWEAFRRHFPSPLSYSAVVSIKALSTNQKDESGSIAPPLPFSLWVWLLLSHWRTCQAVPLRTRRSRVPRTGSGWRVPCLQSEPHTHVIGSIYLLTFARPRQRENTKRNSTEATTLKKIKIKKKKILKRNYHADLIGNKKMYSIYKFFCILVLKT